MHMAGIGSTNVKFSVRKLKHGSKCSAAMNPMSSSLYPSIVPGDHNDFSPRDARNSDSPRNLSPRTEGEVNLMDYFYNFLYDFSAFIGKCATQVRNGYKSETY